MLPFTLVTDLSSGPTSRVDKFIAVNYLADLQKDYCHDLLQDSTTFLPKIDGIEKAGGLGFGYNNPDPSLA